MQIVKTPAKVLTQPAEPVKKFNRSLHSLADKMLKTLKSASDPEGVGLAAPQIGISKRIFVMQTNPSAKNQKPAYLTCVNPEIIEAGSRKQESSKSNKTSKITKNPNQAEDSEKVFLEGCLSINNIWGYPDRYHRLKLRYQDLKGKKRTKTLSGFPAVIAQHELDHLNGTLFTHRVIKQGKQLYRIEKDKKANKPVLVPLEL